MVNHRSRIVVLALVFCGICGCAKQMALRVEEPTNPIPTPLGTRETPDFWGGIYSLPWVIAIGDIYSNGFVQPLGTKNDGFGTLTSLLPAGLETLLSPPLAPRGQHTGRVNRDVRVADFHNDGFPGVISNTY